MLWPRFALQSLEFESVTTARGSTVRRPFPPASTSFGADRQPGSQPLKAVLWECASRPKLALRGAPCLPSLQN